MNLMPISEKLVRGNHTLWKAQILAILCSAQLARFIEGTNPAQREKIKIKAQKGEDLEEVQVKLTRVLVRDLDEAVKEVNLLGEHEEESSQKITELEALCKRLMEDA
jgi:hypothetical protein